jgi:uncharacterized NAD(P)/FAD-binding protein YdhS
MRPPLVHGKGIDGLETIAIIGSGFSGTMAAANLLRLPGLRRVVLIERGPRFARGVAYSTTCASHILNVPAGRMSAYDDDPDHFLRWARERDSAVHGGSFLPRMIYGEYLEDVLQAAAAGTAQGVTLDRINAEAVDIVPQPSGAQVVVRCDDDSAASASLPAASIMRPVAATRVILAIGNFPPAQLPLRDPSAIAHPRAIRDPWEAGCFDTLDPAQPALLIGTGLTMIDVVLELAARGWQGPITAISRRGLMPQPHRSPAKAYHPEPPKDIASWEPTARGLLRALRCEVRRQAKLGVDWREVVTSIRHDTARLWRSLDDAEKRRFLSRLRAHWDTHRHRAAPQAWSAIEGMIRTGRLRILAARLDALADHGDGLRATLRERGREQTTELIVGAVINCTGPETDLARIPDPLLQQLLRRGLIRTDALGLGVDTDEDGAAVDAAGRVIPWLYALGPLRRGQLWETTAVPELRIQAAELARVLAADAAAVAT